MRRAARLPDFLGIGPGRTGTTWLHDVLAGHAGLPAGVKETEFFTTYYSNGIDWYLGHFRHCTDMERIGEICPYFGYSVARERVRTHLPRCRFLVTFRDPVERTYSHYKLMRRYAWARGSFEEALERNPQIIETTRYATHLANWFERFGPESFLIQLYEDLRDDPQRYVDDISEFIGISRIELGASPNLRPDVNTVERAPRSRRLAQNARHLLTRLKSRRAYRTVNLLERLGAWEFCFGRGEVFTPLSADVEMRVRARFRDEIDRLEKLIGRDLSAWKAPRDDVRQPRLATSA
ncbi:MAG: sulfotransferase domain-containing protein [Candidatus Binataceae bacterium]